jgi:hypothetical protein
MKNTEPHVTLIARTSPKALYLEHSVVYLLDRIYRALNAKMEATILTINSIMRKC